MRRFKTNIENLDLPIIDWAGDGEGLGQYLSTNGIPQQISVPFTMPGDTVKINILRRRRPKHVSLLLEVVTPAKRRIEAKCKHFARCGGCNWQHLDYDHQLERKQVEVDRLFESKKTQKIIPCSERWQYRNKMDFSFSQNTAGTQFLGIVIPKMRGKVVTLDECHLVKPWFIEALNITKKWWEDAGVSAYSYTQGTGTLRSLILREGTYTGDQMIILVVSGNADYPIPKSQLNRFVDCMREKFEGGLGALGIFLRVHQQQRGNQTNIYEWKLFGSDYVREKILGKAFKISPAAFFQPNTKQAEKLYQLALDLADIQETDVVYDLFCGVGTIGILAASKAKEVIGIELSPEAVLDARENVKYNELENVTVYQGDVGLVMEDLRKKSLLVEADVAFVDPPRMGLNKKALQHLMDLNPKKIVYLSCKPKTQKKNIRFLELKGYKLVFIQPLDQFPQTVHLENIAVLKRKELE